MKDIILKILQIFENETDDENMLTKQEILDRLAEDGYTIEEKAFYRKINELRDNGYTIEIKKGRQTKYFMRRSRLSKSEWAFLMSLILGNPDLSETETRHKGVRTRRGRDAQGHDARRAANLLYHSSLRSSLKSKFDSIVKL